jgi:iron complex outermembrane receptor protein
VIVTAQRRAENIKDVPMSIATLKGDKLDVLTSGAADIRFLAGRSPSVNVESDYGRTFPRFHPRPGNTDFDLNASQPVGLVMDDIVQENAMLKGFPVFDVDQVECCAARRARCSAVTRQPV